MIPELELEDELIYERDFENELEKDERELSWDDQCFSILNGLSLSEINTLSNFTQAEFDALLELKHSDAINVIKTLDNFENSMPLTDIPFDELEYGRAMRLNVIQKEIDKTGMSLKERMRADSIRETAEDLREIYSDYYDRSLKGVLRDFVLDTEAPEILYFESRLKSNASAYRSVTSKDRYNSAKDLNDIIGVRFVVNDEKDARELVNLFYEKKILDDKNFKLKDSKDYFVTPKVDLETGKTQYRGLHLLLEDNKDSFYKFEVQVHTKESYKSTVLTHEKYVERKRQPRITQKINFQNKQ